MAAIEENLRNFHDFIAEIKSAGKKFPLNQFGEVNISWIAKQIGCTRGTLSNGTLSKHFRNAVNEIGIEDVQNDSNKQDKLAIKAENEIRDISELRKLLATKIKENEYLKQQIDILTEELRKTKYKKTEQEIRFEKFLQDGQRFVL